MTEIESKVEFFERAYLAILPAVTQDYLSKHAALKLPNLQNPDDMDTGDEATTYITEAAAKIAATAVYSREAWLEFFVWKAREEERLTQEAKAITAH
ncbi:MAG TPA: hypothetical protein VE860_09365 [Chthoniobacterales bacterium]|jgi:hypothetical protein|nr:hypothetical protein [Chthoniobacterales bacterium]